MEGDGLGQSNRDGVDKGCGWNGDGRGEYALVLVAGFENSGDGFDGRKQTGAKLLRKDGTGAGTVWNLESLVAAAAVVEIKLKAKAVSRDIGGYIY